MKLKDIIKKAVLSEKAYKLMERGAYTFLTDRRATKEEVSRAVADQFSVDVEKVNIAKVSAKTKRIVQTRKYVKVGGGKKAVVWLKSGQNISLLSPKTKGQKPKDKGEKEVK